MYRQAYMYICRNRIFHTSFRFLWMYVSMYAHKHTCPYISAFNDLCSRNSSKHYPLTNANHMYCMYIHILIDDRKCLKIPLKYLRFAFWIKNTLLWNNMCSCRLEVERKFCSAFLFLFLLWEFPDFSLH